MLVWVATYLILFCASMAACQKMGHMGTWFDRGFSAVISMAVAVSLTGVVFVLRFAIQTLIDWVMVNP